MLDERFMKLAIEKAKEGIRNGQKPFGACLTINGEVISCSHNTEFEASDVTAHAEMNAIREACKKLKTLDLSGSTIYATYKPCKMCFNACQNAKIKRIVYGYSAEGRSKEDYDIELIPNFLREESEILLKIYEDSINS